MGRGEQILIAIIAVSLLQLIVFRSNILEKQTTYESDQVLISLPKKVESPPGVARIRAWLDGAPRGEWHEIAKYVIDQAIAENLLTEKAPHSSASITVVSGFWDYRKMDSNAEGIYKHSFEHSLDQFTNSVFSVGVPSVLFVDDYVFDQLRPLIDDDQTKLIKLPLETLEAMLGPVMHTMKEIQKNPKWNAQAGWLTNSPQARLKSFNLSGFSKIFLLREASRLNPFNTKSFMWLEAGSGCIQGPKFGAQIKIFNRFFDRFFATYFNYEVMGEVHGFPRAPFLTFTGAPASQTSFRILKTHLMGGQSFHIEVVAVVFELALRATLSNPQQLSLGVDECVWAIVNYRFPRLFHLFSNDNSCLESESYDNSCDGFRNGALHCAAIDMALNGLPSRKGAKTA